MMFLSLPLFSHCCLHRLNADIWAFFFPHVIRFVLPKQKRSKHQNIHIHTHTKNEWHAPEKSKHTWKTLAVNKTGENKMKHLPITVYRWWEQCTRSVLHLAFSPRSTQKRWHHFKPFGFKNVFWLMFIAFKHSTISVLFSNHFTLFYFLNSDSLFLFFFFSAQVHSICIVFGFLCAFVCEFLFTKSYE